MSYIIKNLFFYYYESVDMYTPSLLSISTCSKERKKKEEKFWITQALAWLMSIVLSFVFTHCGLLLNTFVCEQEVSLHISFAYCCSLKFESSTLCTTKQQTPKSMFCFITFILEDDHRSNLGMLMDVKCIHELCSLLPYIPTYLHIL
jgi:hypothetical protein